MLRSPCPLDLGGSHPWKVLVEEQRGKMGEARLFLPFSLSLLGQYPVHPGTSFSLGPSPLSSPFLFPTQPRAFLRLPLSYLCPECVLSFLPSLLLLNSPAQLSHHHLIYQHFLFFPPSPFALCTVSSVGLACSAWNHRVWSVETGSSFYPGGSSRGRVKSRRPPSQPLRSTAHLPPAWAVQSCQETVSLHVSWVVQG